MTLTRSPLKRGPAKLRHSEIRKVNPKRRQSEFARCYHSKERVAFVKSLGCLVCLRLPSENAHATTDGIGRKADYMTVIPLCRGHHRRYDEHQHPFDNEASRLIARDRALWVEKAWQQSNRHTTEEAK